MDGSPRKIVDVRERTRDGERWSGEIRSDEKKERQKDRNSREDITMVMIIIRARQGSEAPCLDGSVPSDPMV